MKFLRNKIPRVSEFSKSKKLIATLFCVSFLFIAHVNLADAATFFMDNTLTTGANDGSSWPNAFHSIADMKAAFTAAANHNYDTIYIKATDVPYREIFTSGYFSNKTIYGDAVGGTGTETTRGSDKAEFWGSFDLSSYTWVQEGSSNVYRADNVVLDSTQNDPQTTWGASAWYYTSPTAITTLVYGYSNPITNLTSGKVYYKESTNQVWVNIGTNPNGKHIEIVNMDYVIEPWNNEQIYGVVVKHGKYGSYNTGCSGWTISESEFSYNNEGANNLSSYLSIPSYFTKSSIHNNYEAGIYDNAGYFRNLHYQNNLIYNNGSYGMYLQTHNLDTSANEMGYIENNTIYGNGGYGIYIKMNGWSRPENWTVKNNIVLGHTTAQLYMENNALIHLTASNNAVGATNKYAGVWEANKGTGNVETDPLLVSSTDFRLQSSSPAINAGVDLGITTDYLGTAIPRGAAPDIGAYEYDATSPALSSASINSRTSATPSFTFVSDEAGIISYAGDCTSSTTAAVSGTNTIVFSTLSEATHSNCKVTVTDPAGNASSQLSVPSFIVDITAPTGGAFTVNSNATETNSATVTLGITCPTDPWLTVQMAYGVTASPTNWTTCTSSQSYTLTSPDETKTIYVRFKDGGDNATSDLTKTIIYDTTVPSNVSISHITIDSPTQLTIVADTPTDSGSGLAAAPYWFQETTGHAGAVSSTDWQTSNSFTNSGLSSNIGYAYKVKVKDAAGNISEYSASVPQTPMAIGGGSSYTATITPATSTTTTITPETPTTTATPATQEPAQQPTQPTQSTETTITQIKSQLIILLTQVIQMLTEQIALMR